MEIIEGLPHGCEGSPAIGDFSAADWADYGPSSGIPGAAPAISIRRGQKDAPVRPLLCSPPPRSHSAAPQTFGS